MLLLNKNKSKRNNMCGIAGFIDFNKNTNLNTLKEMTDILSHRGPDDSGYEFFKEDFAFIGLGHRRLSILDLSKKASQPMKYKNLSIVYNGEVYNFKEIRKELLKYGYSFNSDSDTEVVLKSFHKWGIKALDKFIGMFSFVIYDSQEKSVYFARDRAGVKPFYYYYKDDLFLFASELKSFHCHPKFIKNISKDGIASYFKYGYIISPYTIFQNTFKLPPANWAKLNLKTKKFELFKYWDQIKIYNEEKLEISPKEAVKEVEKILISSFKYRMVSDVDVGVFLSGGYDSTCVTALLQKDSTKKLKTFTIGFHEEDFNEAVFAKEYAKILGTDHHELYINQKDILSVIEDIAFIYDEPFSDNSIFPTLLVSKFAKSSVSVALSADGGDEIFGGYTKYRDIYSLMQKMKLIKNLDSILLNQFIPFIKSEITKNMVFSLKIKNTPNQYNKLIDILKSESQEEIFERANMILSDYEIENLIKSPFLLQTNFNTFRYLNEQNDIISKAMAIDYSTYMSDDILVKVDRASMSVSLEAREPFLDQRILEFVAKLPTSIKLYNGSFKYLIKEIVHKYIPKEIIQRPKKGFSIPIKEWYEDQLKDFFKEAINEKDIKEQGILNYEAVKNIIKRYNNGESNMINIIWQIFLFQLWCKRWL